MADTQWPRYYVFEQPEDGAAFILAGSVHAPDGEMALLIARDTFARRPQRTAMWVARDARITSRTREQLAAGEQTGNPVPGKTPFQVFAKRSHRGVHSHVGEVAAADPEAAIHAAVDRFGEGKEVVWLVIADVDIRRSGEADRGVLYGSTPGKRFRHESEYPVRTMMLNLKKKSRGV